MNVKVLQPFIIYIVSIFILTFIVHKLQSVIIVCLIRLTIFHMWLKRQPLDETLRLGYLSRLFVNLFRNKIQWQRCRDTNANKTLLPRIFHAMLFSRTR